MTDKIIQAMAEGIDRVLNLHFSDPHTPVNASELAQAAYEAYQQHCWQPVESAPKDGTHILLGGGTWRDCGNIRSEPRTARWMGVNQFYPHRSPWVTAYADAGDSFTTYENPTHFMPLPQPPKEVPKLGTTNLNNEVIKSEQSDDMAG